MFCHTKSPKSPHGLCLWIPHLYVCTGVPNVPGPCVRRVRGDGRGERAFSRGRIDLGLVDDALRSSRVPHVATAPVLNVVFIHCQHQHMLATSYPSAACRLADDLRKRAREAKRWTLRSSVIPAFPRSVLLLALSASAPCGETSDCWVREKEFK